MLQHSHLHIGVIEPEALRQLTRSFDYVSRVLERVSPLPREAADRLARVMIGLSTCGERDSLALIKQGVALYDGTRNELE